MEQLNKQLGITAIRMTPYHPQTNERYPKLQRDSHHSSWQAGTRTSGPAEERLGGGACIQDGGERHRVVMLEMQDRLERYREQAKENLQEKLLAQKRWYDQHARLRQFQPGQKVLLLLPTSTSKLLAKWQGPYTVLCKMGPVRYEVYHTDKGKTRQTYHVNLLQEWKVPPGKGPETSLLLRKVEEESEDAKRQPSVVCLSHLEDSKMEELQHLLNQFPALFCQRSGRTELAQHTIHLSDPSPSRQHPYRVPERLVEPLKEEIKMMKELGVIEPSTSEWSSPMVIVPKNDRSLRVCIDFSKLNAHSKFDAYPMPRVHDLLEKIGRAQYITTLDLCKGYWQVPLNPDPTPHSECL
ncbi:Transposon Ty3-I Gag-Pol polyprotein [Labeo rohita]|uniref:Transposon Ty3-I Gag-Pol polyprotein n=1 Tax=Labeo rohita TaxID=84645 RepID=A0ABQ8LW75_LABRO|nr:Transposon Ty3-I Gag-Pol polyprotein [Labeo rohita]